MSNPDDLLAGADPVPAHHGAFDFPDLPGRLATHPPWRQPRIGLVAASVAVVGVVTAGAIAPADRGRLRADLDGGARRPCGARADLRQDGGMTTPGWYGDPAGLGEARWWDGTAWTHAVMRGGQSVDVPLPDGSSRPVVTAPGTGVAAQVAKSGLQMGVQGGGTIFTEPVLVVNQKAKVFEVTNEYKVFDANGTQIAAVVEIGQNAFKKVLRALSNFDQFMSHTLEIREASGQPVLVVRQGAKFIRSKTTVTRPGYGPVGMLSMKTTFRKARFEMTDPTGVVVGTLQAENWRAWDFAILDASGREVARVKKTFEGIAKALFTTADNYVLRLHEPLQEPLLSLVVASALTIDTSLKQGNG